ncbi:hypothetical protein [Kribbella shirazensis]|uniref:Carbohydrate-binding domain-containing protein n=1 Tax=Kribbella shirazensis TaxID=1105143 RepID=A0A7X6A5E2_9ACTN|nr:hypothetical protein [Kribbella shirazensis]NIK62015.1 hypothetical protein [Kribbella shirazensis]
MNPPSFRRRTAGTIAMFSSVGLLAAALVPLTASAVDPSAVAVLGATPSYTGVVKAWPGDADKDPAHAATEKAGRQCWQMSGDPYVRYLYVDVADSAIPAGADRALVTVDYYDAGATNLDIQYDGDSSAWTTSSNQPLTGTGAWTSHTFELSKINFANRSNGADFRLNVKASATAMPDVCFARVAVTFTDVPQLAVTNPDLVFFQGDTTLRFATLADSVNYTIGDENGVPLRTGRVTPDAAGQASAGLNDLGPGFYTLTFSGAVGGTTLTRSSSFGVVTPPPAGAHSPDAYFGVGTHFGHYGGYEDALLRTMADIGWGQTRSDISWSGVEPAPGTYDFARYPFDARARQIKALGVEPMGNIAYRNQFYDGGRTPSTPEGLAAFGRYAKAAAERYVGVTNDFGIYNEFNSTGFNNGACGITAACYLDMLKATAEPIREGNPNANVIGPVTAGISQAWLDDFFALGGLNHLDTFATNFYGYASLGQNTPPEKTVLTKEFPDLVRKVDSLDGDRNLPVWVTENGWPTHTAGSTEPQQADNLIRAQVLAKAAGADKYIWYDAMDDGDDPGEREHRFGLFRRPNAGVLGVAPKPGAISNAALIRMVTGKQQQAREDLGSATAYSYPYAGGGETTRVLWSTGTEQVQLTADQPLRLTDQFGAARTITPHDGKVTLTLDASPVFVTGTVQQAVVVQSPLSVSVGTSTVAGDAVPVIVTADRTVVSDALPAKLVVTAAGRSAELVTAPGKKTSVTVQLPASAVLGERSVAAAVGTRDRELVANLRAATKIVEPLLAAAEPTISTTADGYAYGLKVTLTNNRDRAVTPTAIRYSVGAVSGSAAAPTVAARGTASVTVPVSAVSLYESTAFRVAVDGPDPKTVGGTLSYSPIEPQAAPKLAPIDLDKQGRFVPLRGGTRTGPADLGGKLRFSQTADALVVDAVITDDVHHGARSNDLLWQTDSIQFDTYDRFPSVLGGQRVEIGAALLDSGPAVYTFTAPAGQQAGPTPGAAADITRANGVTTYRLTIPWAALGFDGPPTQVIGLSFLANDDDAGINGDARKGWLEWGSGVGTAPKNPALFRSAQVVK